MNIHMYHSPNTVNDVVVKITSGQTILTKGCIVCRTAIEDWMIPSATCTTAETPSAFQWAEQPPHCPFPWRDVNPHLIHGSFSPHDGVGQRQRRPLIPSLSVIPVYTQVDSACYPPWDSERVSVKGQWCSVAENITQGLAESNGSLPPGK